MFISGSFVRPVDRAADKSSSGSPELIQGETIGGRVTQVNGRGEGVLRLADGRGFSFSGGQALREGEHVRMEVVRIQPQVVFRLLNSESGAAQRLASDMEQSLMRSPDLFSRLISLSGLEEGGGKDSGLFSLAARQGGKVPLFVTGKGESMGAVLQKILPNVSLHSLQKEGLSELVRLFRGGGAGEIQDMVRQIRDAANDLRPAANAPGNVGGSGEVELAAARHVLSRVGDLVAMQDILPRATPNPDGNPFLGYRLFWLDDRGLGELIWRQHQGNESSGGGGGDKEVTSVLITLSLTRLGSVQARLSFADNALQVAIGAEDDDALAALRGDIRLLRQALIHAELPLRSLELSRLTRADVQEERHRILELGEGFSIEV